MNIIGDLHFLLNGWEFVFFLSVVAMIVAAGRSSGLDRVIVRPRSAAFILGSVVAAGWMIWAFLL